MSQESTTTSPESELSSLGRVATATGGFQWESVPGTRPALALLILAGLLLFMPPVLYQLREFMVGWHDVGLVSRIIQNFMEHGRFYMTNPGAQDFLATEHVSPFLVVLGPVVRLFGAEGYVICTTLAMVAASVFLYLFAREVLRQSGLALLVACAFLANPYTSAIVFSYHWETFAVLFLLAFAYFSSAGKTAGAFVTLVLALTVKEDVWLYACVCAVLTARKGELKRTAGYLGVSIAYYIGVLTILHRLLYPGSNLFVSWYGSHSSSRLDIALGLLRRWREYLVLLFSGSGWAFQKSFLFLPILAHWRYLLACGVLLLWLSFPGGPPRSVLGYYYSFPALTLFFVVLPFALRELQRGLAWLGQRLSERWRLIPRLAPVLLSVLVIGMGIWMQQPENVPRGIASVVVRAHIFREPAGHPELLHALIEKYVEGTDESVLTQFSITPYVIRQPEVYQVLYDGPAFTSGKLLPSLVLLDMTLPEPGPSRANLEQVAVAVTQSPQYEPLYADDGVLLFRRKR